MIPDFVKASATKAALEKLTEGDAGSTALGTIAGGLLAANLDFGKLMHGLQTEQSAAEVGKAIAVLVLAVWGYFIGRKKAKAGAK